MSQDPPPPPPAFHPPYDHAAARLVKQAFFWAIFISHIFPKAQVASNKNAHKLRNHFWAEFFMLTKEINIVVMVS